MEPTRTAVPRLINEPQPKDRNAVLVLSERALIDAVDYPFPCGRVLICLVENGIHFSDPNALVSAPDEEP
jgi:hypothetical protein